VVESQTIWDQVDALARRLKPAWSRLREEALKTGLIGLDQTHWKVIGHKKSWQMWELCTPEIAYFSIAQSKGADDGIELLKGFKGTVICDALGTHGAIANRVDGIRIAHCWAHPFRYARVALQTDKARATNLMELIGELYEIDKKAGADLELRAKLRETESRAVLDKLWSWIREQRVLPSSPVGKLIAYLTNHRQGFEVFLSEASIPLDNNSAERGYLWPAIGRRAFVGSRSERGTQVAAIFYSLAESARRNEIDPKAYFKAATEDALADRVIRLPHEVST
jgi:transposase